MNNKLLSKILKGGILIPTKIKKHKSTLTDLVKNDLKNTSGLSDVYDVEYKIPSDPTKKD